MDELNDEDDHLLEDDEHVRHRKKMIANMVQRVSKRYEEKEKFESSVNPKKYYLRSKLLLKICEEYKYFMIRISMATIGFLYGFIAETYFHYFFIFIVLASLFCLFKEYLYLCSIRRPSHNHYMPTYSTHRDRIINKYDDHKGWRCKFDCKRCRYTMYSLTFGVIFGGIFAIYVIEKNTQVINIE